MQSKVELNSLWLSLLLLWILLAPGECQDAGNLSTTATADATKAPTTNEMLDDTKLALSIFYHHKPKKAYKGHLVQGACIAPKAVIGNLVLAVRKDKNLIGEYWFHNNNFHTILKSPNFNVEKVNMSADFNVEEDRPGLKFQFCVREIIELICYFVDSALGSQETRKEIIVPFIFPRKPAFVVDYHLEPWTLIEGELLRIGCAAVVGHNGKLTVRILARSDVQEEKWVFNFNDTRTHPAAVVRKEHTIMGPTIKALIQIVVSPRLANRWFICTATDEDDYFEERSEQKKAAVETFRVKPVITIQALVSDTIAWTIDGRCFPQEQEMMQVDFSFRTSDRVAVYFGPNAKNYSETDYLNRDYQGPRSFMSNIFEFENWALPPKVRFTVTMTAQSKKITLSCSIRGLQVCREYTYQHVSPFDVHASDSHAEGSGPDDDGVYMFITIMSVLVAAALIGFLFSIVLDSYLKL